MRALEYTLSLMARGTIDGHVPMTVLALKGRPPPAEWSVFYVHHVLVAAGLEPGETTIREGQAEEVYREIRRRGVGTGTTAEAARRVLEAQRQLEIQHSLEQEAHHRVDGPDSCCHRGEVRLHLGRYRDAIKDYEMLRRREPFRSRAHHGLARASALLGNLEAAERHYASAMHLCRTVAVLTMRAELIEVLVRAEKREDALAELRIHLADVEAELRAGAPTPFLLDHATGLDTLVRLVEGDAALAAEAARVDALARDLAPKPKPDRLRPPSY